MPPKCWPPKRQRRSWGQQWPNERPRAILGPRTATTKECGCPGGDSRARGFQWSSDVRRKRRFKVVTYDDPPGQAARLTNVWRGRRHEPRHRFARPGDLDLLGLAGLNGRNKAGEVGLCLVHIDSHGTILAKLA